MKKPLLRSLFPAAVLACLAYSCSERLHAPDAPSPDLPHFTLAEAKRAFAEEYAAVPGTRTGGEFDENAVLDPLRIDPAWDAVSFLDCDTLSQAVVPFGARYDYRLLRWDEQGRPSLFPLPHRLVVVKDSDTGRTNAWLYFEIRDPNDELLSTDNRFSGVTLYTTLSGLPVSAGRYADGDLTVSASLFDESRPREEHLARLADLLPKVHIARLGTRIATRGVNDNNDIDPVEIIGHAPIKLPEMPSKPDFPEMPVVPPFENRNKLPIGIDGGAPDTSGDSEQTYPNNPRITVKDEAIGPYLDSLYLDCMGQILINSINCPVKIIRDNSSSGSKSGGSWTIPDANGQQAPVSFTIIIGTLLTTPILMEELMHIYQGVSSIPFKQTKLNKEIEAKLTWYIYMYINNLQHDVTVALGGPSGQLGFDIMRKCILSDNSDDWLCSIAYQSAAKDLRDIESYKYETDYPFDPNNMDLSKLQELLDACLKNK